MTSSVAYSELTRVLPWSIRACGYAFGTADRASFLVANAASMAPEVLSDIAALDERPPEHPQRRWSDGVLSIHARGVSWLEVGPALMDYCGAHAAEPGGVVCRVFSATEPALLPAILLVAAEYGLSAAAIGTRGEALRWTMLSLEGDKPARPMLLSGEGREGLERSLGEGHNVSDFPEASEEVMIVAWRKPSLPTPAAPEAIDAEACIRAAFAQGIPVSPEVLEGLYELEKITWAPTSERSRAQAGFQTRSAG